MDHINAAELARRQKEYFDRPPAQEQAPADSVVTNTPVRQHPLKGVTQTYPLKR